VIESISVPIELTDREALIKCASTSLNSKVVSQFAPKIAPMVVDAVLKVQSNGNCDLRDIKVSLPDDVPARMQAMVVGVPRSHLLTLVDRILHPQVIRKLEGTIDDSEMIDGVIFDKKVSHTAGGTDRVTNAKVLPRRAQPKLAVTRLRAKNLLAANTTASSSWSFVLLTSPSRRSHTDRTCTVLPVAAQDGPGQPDHRFGLRPDGPGAPGGAAVHSRYLQEDQEGWVQRQSHPAVILSSLASFLIVCSRIDQHASGNPVLALALGYSLWDNPLTPVWFCLSVALGASHPKVNSAGGGERLGSALFGQDEDPGGA
jgi:hypothetical protein